MSPNTLKIIFLGRKPGASEALRFLVSHGHEVKLVVAPEQEHFSVQLKQTAETLGIPVLTDDKKLYELIEAQDPLVSEIDLVISYLFWKKVKSPLLKLGKLPPLNFHPGPLPEFKGWASYNYAILEQVPYWGATAHVIDESFDTGPIVQVKTFPLDPETEIAYLLEKKTQKVLLELFYEVMQKVETGEPLQTKPNAGGVYWTKEEMEAAKIVDPHKDSPELIKRKIRAFFFPPYSGASVKMGENYYTLVDDFMLHYLQEILAQYYESES